MIKTIAKWLLYAAALLAVAWLYPGIAISSYGAALIAAAVIGLLNCTIRPILRILTLPITILTLGLFTFVLNAGMFWIASRILDSFHITTFFWAAIIGSLLYSIFLVIADWLLEMVFGSKKENTA